MPKNNSCQRKTWLMDVLLHPENESAYALSVQGDPRSHGCTSAERDAKSSHSGDANESAPTTTSVNWANLKAKATGDRKNVAQRSTAEFQSEGRVRPPRDAEELENMKIPIATYTAAP